MQQHQIAHLVAFLDEQGLLSDFKGRVDRTTVGPCSCARQLRDGFCFIGKKVLHAGSVSLDCLALILVPNDLEDELIDSISEQAESEGTAIVFTTNPRLAFLSLVQEFYVDPVPAGIHPDATLHETCIVHETALICAGARLGPGVVIGARSVVRENCVITAAASIGEDCYIGPGTMIGQPGFGYERTSSGEMVKFPHIGSIEIGDNVEIGANTCIDCGTLDNTIIRDGAKIDNLCHLAHNVDVKEDAVIIANSMIGGSASIGQRSWLAPACTIFNGVRIGDDATVGMHSLVTKDVSDGQTVLGVPAIDREILRERRKQT